MHLNPNIRVICLPYAGGSATAFQSLKSYWPKSWEVVTLELKGRGRRLKEPLQNKMKDLVEDYWQQVKLLIEEPYVLFGHSLGATLIYLLAHRIKKEGNRMPEHLFIIGTDAPSVPPRKPYRYQFSRLELKSELKKYGGIPNEILDDDEVFYFFENIIRADLEAIETWAFIKKEKLNVSATVITGTEEDIDDNDIKLWQEEFSSHVSFEKIEGNHFFLFSNKNAFVDLLVRRMSMANKFLDRRIIYSKQRARGY